MLSLGSLAFASPWLLAALAVLPVLWWLLRVTPPAPKRLQFPALQLLLGLRPREETPARTPLWLILLRMALAGLIIVALAHPLLNPNARLGGTGPLILAVDDGWAAARGWDKRQAAMQTLLDQADREDRRVVLLSTAGLPGDQPAPVPSVQRPADARAAAETLQPRPWAVDRKAALARLQALTIEGTAQVVWLSDGIDDGSAQAFAAGLDKLGPLRVMTDDGGDLARLAAAGDPDDKDLSVLVKRADRRGEAPVSVRALADDGRLLTRQESKFANGDTQRLVKLPMPSELRNLAASIQIEGEASAGAVFLLDERWRRRPVGIIAPKPVEAAQPLLSGYYYLERALSPFSEIRRGTVDQLLSRQIAVMILPDATPAGPTERDRIQKWMENGGTLLRFAGNGLADQRDDSLLPVQLRRGGRTLGGALSWEQPARLAPFTADSPFAGLPIPGDVTVSRQVLAEPSIDLAGKTWARLTDGTPLVTAEKRGKGRLVLVHTTSDPEWSNLAMSGLFIGMLRRVVSLSEGVGEGADVALPPVETLDGFGRLQRAPSSAQTIQAGGFQGAAVGPTRPPGFYGTPDARRALNLSASVTQLQPIGALPGGAIRETYAKGDEVDFRPWLLGGALSLALIDLLVAYALRGFFSGLGRRRSASVAAFLLTLLAVHPVLAQTDERFTLQATTSLHLAYIRTGIPEVDDQTRAGLTGLTTILRARTAVEATAPMEVDPETDELIFFPLLYWPVAVGQQLPSAKGIERLNRYLSTGGTILFDTRDQGTRSRLSGGATDQLRQLTAGLNIPSLAPVSPEHVLTKSFYLLQDFPGRWAGGQLWVEPVEDQVNDGVASVIVGGADWAGAWAVDQRGRPILPVVPGGEQQREMAYRFGVNLVMYTLTGNYKTDQVHVPSILERLGQ